MAEYQAFVGDTNNSVIGDINVLVDLPVEGTPTGGTSVTYTSTDPVYAGVSVVLTGTGIVGSPSSTWTITGIEAFHNGQPIWDITGLSNSIGNDGIHYSGEPIINGTPITGSFNHHSIFQAVDFGVAPHLMFADVNNDIYGGPGDEGVFGFGRAGHTVTVHAGHGTNLIGGDGGNAILYAGTGPAAHDAFLFNYDVFTGSNLSTIHGFNPSKDILELSHGDFQRTHFGVLTAAEFHSGPGAPSTTGADIVYNHANGHLYYDSNGAAAGGLHLFAILVGHPNLIASDIIVA
jgi:hypothetical protein